MHLIIINYKLTYGGKINYLKIFHSASMCLRYAHTLVMRKYHRRNEVKYVKTITL